MGQRINIQYSVDVDELPREVGRLLEGVFNEYQMLQVDCALTGEVTLLSHEMVEKIDKIRVSLGAIDHGLSDASNIISGYLGYKAQECAPKNAEGPPLDLEEKLSKFKEMLETTQDEVPD